MWCPLQKDSKCEGWQTRAGSEESSVAAEMAERKEEAEGRRWEGRGRLAGPGGSWGDLGIQCVMGAESSDLKQVFSEPLPLC